MHADDSVKQQHQRGSMRGATLQGGWLLVVYSFNGPTIVDSGGQRGVVKRRHVDHPVQTLPAPLALPALLCCQVPAALTAPGNTLAARGNTLAASGHTVPPGRVPRIERLRSAVTIRGGKVVEQRV